jgi:hypothetical protein
MSVAEVHSAFDFFADVNYGKIINLWEHPDLTRRCYWSEEAKARLANISGWLLGLAHGGKKELAENLAEDFWAQLRYVARSGESREIDFGNGLTRSVPAGKVTLLDDGTLHGFSIVMYYPIDPTTWDKKYAALQAAQPDCAEWEIEQAVSRHLKVQSTFEGQDLTETVYLPEERRVSVRYRAAANGSLVYHGPGGGETFTVSLSRSAWSVNT